MNLANIFDNVFEDNETIYIEDNETINESFMLTPLVAFLTFKDDVFKKANSAVEKATAPLDKAAGQVDRLKSKLEINSGKEKNDTVYKFTKEQKKFLVYIYRKYGKDVLKEIQKFRTNIAAPYQVIKRNVAKNKTLTDKEIHGMTKEEYDRYRESGARKIRNMSTQADDYNVLYKNNSKISDEKTRLEKAYDDAKKGKGVINFSQIEKMLDKLGYGEDSLKKWPPEELRATANKISELEGELKKQTTGGKLIVSSKRKGKIRTVTPKELKNEIEYLREFGYSSYIGKRVSSDSRKGEFKEAFNNYIIRGYKKRDIEENFDKSSYKDLYLKALKDELDEMNRRYSNSIDNLSSFSKKYKLNSYEEKIWGLKPTGSKASGDLNDWYLKIKPEDFKGTINFKKSSSVVKAEKEFDKELKAFERKLKTIISEEDWKLLLKYRLVNNFITVKELKSGKNMFKTESDLPDNSYYSTNIDDLKLEIDDLKRKDFESFKEMEKSQKDIKKKINSLFGKEKKEAQEYAKEFLSRNDTGDRSSKDISSDISKINELAERIASSNYSNEKIAYSDLRELDNKISEFRTNYPDDTSKLNSINYSIEKARSKINAFINSGEN